jgi:hypothetical protein
VLATPGPDDAEHHIHAPDTAYPDDDHHPDRHPDDPDANCSYHQHLNDAGDGRRDTGAGVRRRRITERQ